MRNRWIEKISDQSDNVIGFVDTNCKKHAENLIVIKIKVSPLTHFCFPYTLVVKYSEKVCFLRPDENICLRKRTFVWVRKTFDAGKIFLEM